MRIETAISLVLAEFHRAKQKYPDHPTVEHSMFVLQEEIDELRDELRIKDVDRDQKRIVTEAAQGGAMLLRFLVDCCEEPKED